MVIKGRDATLLRNGKPFRTMARLDGAWYTLPQAVTLVRLKGRAGEEIDLRQCALPPCNATIVNPSNPKTYVAPGTALAARVEVHFHRYFDAPPMRLEHTITIDGHGGATQHTHLLHDPERTGVPRRVQVRAVGRRP